MKIDHTISNDSNYFLQVLRDLRENEEIILYGNILEISDLHAQQAGEYLLMQYEQEKLGYPFDPPSFDSHAAVWGARILYISAQLVLYRQTKESDLANLLPSYQGEKNAGAILSADLCLRFIPDILVQLKLIDYEDGLIAILENHLRNWHYSGVQYKLEIEDLDFEIIISDRCLKQLYIDRVIQCQRIDLAKQVNLVEGVKSSMSIFADHFWKEFKKETSYENDKC